MVMTRTIRTTLASITFLLAISAAAAAQVGKPVTIIDANAATEAELAAMPGLNATIAKAIAGRRPFADVTAFDQFITSQGLNRTQATALYERTFIHLNLNTATREQILLIPRAGQRMAREFEEYRPYRAMAQFQREIAKYVDATELARLGQYVFVPINLNTASDADILTIPGLGNRMLREFKEYRPYTSIEQFRREIGKYVSKEEVARFERYVTIQ
jgi:DNA uptake protein ComE-like DNA-binding protein